jgi:hypothetical protein
VWTDAENVAPTGIFFCILLYSVLYPYLFVCLDFLHFAFCTYCTTLITQTLMPSAEFDPRTVQPVASRYADWAVPAHFRSKYNFFYGSRYKELDATRFHVVDQSWPDVVQKTFGKFLPDLIKIPFWRWNMLTIRQDLHTTRQFFALRESNTEVTQKYTQYDVTRLLGASTERGQVRKFLLICAYVGMSIASTGDKEPFWVRGVYLGPHVRQECGTNSRTKTYKIWHADFLITLLRVCGYKIN